MSDEPARVRFRLGGHLVLGAAMLYFLLPLWWLVVASTKSTAGLYNGSAGPLWFDGDFNLVENLRGLAEYNQGQYFRWLGNSFLYAFLGGGGATVLSVLAGYAFAKYAFRGRSTAFLILLASVMVPVTALVIPTYMLLNSMALTNTVWAVLLPSLLNPFGVYLMRVYIQDSVPDELLDAARIDGAGELRIFTRIALPMMRPAVVTVLLLAVVGTWNNYFLPLTMLSNPNLMPVTVGLQRWQAQSQSAASAAGIVWDLVACGALVSILPLIAAFLLLQRYWRGGLSLGSLK
jgi:multiple sugar transport system permease protein